MEVDKVIAALDSELRREILRIVSKEPMTAIQVFEDLKKSRMKIKYRETVYRGLEKLFDAGLVDKFYVKEKGLCYKATAKSISIDIVEGKVEKEPSM
jgi:Fe2+ or Zn2+ uptake regulation protein